MTWMKKIYIGTGSFLAMVFVWAHGAMAESVMDKINANLDKFQSKTGLGTETEPEKIFSGYVAHNDYERILLDCLQLLLQLL